MKIFVKQFSGRTIVLEVTEDIEIVDLAVMAYNKRAESQKNATNRDYAKSVDLMHTFRKLDYSKKLSDYHIVDGSTINEIPKSFTMSPNFHWETLSLLDPISLGNADEPYMLNPGCAHSFDKSELKHWVKTKLEEHQKPNCPTCRTDIPLDHLLKIMLFAPPSSANSTSSTVNDLNQTHSL